MGFFDSYAYDPSPSSSSEAPRPVKEEKPDDDMTPSTTDVSKEKPPSTKRAPKDDEKDQVLVANNKKKKTQESLLGAGERAGPGAVGNETDRQALVEKWQSMAAGASTAELRRFLVLCGVLMASQTVSGTACRALGALRKAAREAGAEDLTPAWLAGISSEDIAGIISMVNYRNTKAKALREVALTVKMARGRVATTRRGYEDYRGVGKELAGLLVVVNTPDLARAWCEKSIIPT